MRRIVAAITVVLLAVIGAPAGAQMGGPTWNPDRPRVEESAGEIVLTLSLTWGRPARVLYQTVDGTAKQDADYTAVSGEEVFTGDDTRTIRIPIRDDGVAEDYYESFTVEYWEEPPPADRPYPYRATVLVTIVDNDGGDDGDGDGAPAPKTDSGRSANSAPASTAPATRSEEIGDRPRLDLAAELPAPDLEPGPGFELTAVEPMGPATGQRDGGGQSAWWLILGGGGTALTVAALAPAWRRRQWSPTHA